jgi:hypothetical protein
VPLDRSGLEAKHLGVVEAEALSRGRAHALIIARATAAVTRFLRAVSDKVDDAAKKVKEKIGRGDNPRT